VRGWRPPQNETEHERAVSVLHIDFAGELHQVEPGMGLTFGREADLYVDTNPYLHRRVGAFRQRAGGWWLSNIGSSIAIKVCDQSSPSRLTVAPGSSAPLPFQDAVVRFQAGSNVYNLRVSMPDSDLFSTDDPYAGPRMAPPERVPLNDEQRLLLVSLAELRLRDVGAPNSAIPSNRSAARRLRWSKTKFNRKLDNLCTKFERLGVGGLKGDSSDLASNRRELLVDHVLTVGLIGQSDLELLEGRDRSL